ncbi:MAG: DUF1847 domain-containing protein [Promethearchaeota archaeon]
MNVRCHECNGFCAVGRKNRKKEDCPMNCCNEILDEARKIYESDESVKNATKNASIVEASGYMQWPRLKDTIEYAKLMGYQKIGLAYCIGLREEARIIANILEKYGFSISSVCCKTGCMKKVDIGVPKEYTGISKTGHAIGLITCNPVAQALLLNEAGTELNLIVGLCVGHDITFTQHSKAPVSTLIAKDRVTMHNPAAMLYTSYGNAFWLKDRKESS